MFISSKSIHQPKARLAKFAVQQLIAKIREPNQPIQEILLEPELVWRESI